MKAGNVRLGELLEQRGLVAREQILRALRNQKVLGGRLGTCLLEIEAISEEDLVSALAELQGAPPATPEELRGITDEIIELVPGKVAKRCLAIPFHASSTQVKVAVADARDLTVQGEVAFVIGKRIRWHVVPELRIHEALEKYYGQECPTRIAKLLDRLNRTRFLWARESASRAAAISSHSGTDLLRWDLGTTDGAGVAPPPESSMQTPVGEESEKLLPQPEAPASPRLEVPEVETVRPPFPPESLPSPTNEETHDVPHLGAPRHRLSLAEVEKNLLDPADRDDVARNLVDFATSRARRAALLVVRRQEIAVWRWGGEGLDGPRLAAYRSSFREPSIFVGLRDGAGIFRGVLPPMPAHIQLLAAFDPPPDLIEMTALPIRVRSRLVAVLLVEPQGERLASADLDELQRVAAKAAIAFELCIMRGKLRQA